MNTQMKIPPYPGRTAMKSSTLLALLCLAVLCITLSLGLWPFHSPRNAVSWLANQDVLELGRNATLFSSRSLSAPEPPEATVEIWLLPQRIWDAGTFLSFYQAGRSQFTLRQSLTDLLLQRETPSNGTSAKTARLYVDDLFRPRRPVFLTVTSGPRGVCIYLDGVLAKTAPHFPLSAQDFAGRLILGDSAGQTDSWKGQFFRLAIYQRQLTPYEVLQNYTAWKEKGRPATSGVQRPFALYLFDEHSGNIVHDRAGSGVDLYIPQTYQVIDKIFLEPVWSEFAMTQSYWSAALKNIVGFLPFGFCFYPYLLTAFQPRRPRLLTVLLGTAVSLTIEVLQGFLPTRDSGTTDIITNTLGTWIGVVCYVWLAPTMARIFPWFPFPAPARR
jgi:hypothetical protein